MDSVAGALTTAAVPKPSTLCLTCIALDRLGRRPSAAVKRILSADRNNDLAASLLARRQVQILSRRLFECKTAPVRRNNYQPSRRGPEPAAAGRSAPSRCDLTDLPESRESVAKPASSRALLSGTVTFTIT